MTIDRIPSLARVMVLGIGRGVCRFRPGSVRVALGKGKSKALAFVAAMLAGMTVFELLELRPPAMTPRAA